MVIKASHEPIISPELFDEVQDVLNGRKRKFPTRQTAKVKLPLRGYLECKQFGNKLPGSASKGNGGNTSTITANMDAKKDLRQMEQKKN